MTFIKYSKKSQKDLESIYCLIAEDKKRAADEFLNSIESYILLLKTNPEMGIECREKGFNRDCRVLFYGNYTILYKITNTHIAIQRVINTKQNYKGKN